MLRATIRQTLFRQNIVSENSPNFNDAKVSRYTVVNFRHQLTVMMSLFFHREDISSLGPESFLQLGNFHHVS